MLKLNILLLECICRKKPKETILIKIFGFKKGLAFEFNLFLLFFLL